MVWATIAVPAAATIIVALLTRHNREVNEERVDAAVSALTKIIDVERKDRIACQDELEKVNKRLARVEARVGLKRSGQ